MFSVMMSMMLVQTRKNTVLQVSRNNLKFAACLTLHPSSIHLLLKTTRTHPENLNSQRPLQGASLPRSDVRLLGMSYNLRKGLIRAVLNHVLMAPASPGNRWIRTATSSIRTCSWGHCHTISFTDCHVRDP